MIISIIYFALYFGVFLAILVLQLINRQYPPAPRPDEPPVSILIAFRNEEQNIIPCLDAIGKLSYPSNKIEVLLGDDASTDSSYKLVQKYIEDKPNFKCIQIKEKLGQARGKANVLAHLTKLSNTDFFFITDADIQVPPTWIKNILAGIKSKVAIVTGITTIKGAGIFEKLQAIDWINAVGLMQIVADLKLSVSTMGNNMLITRQAYEATGGYENMPFSVIEDVQLFKEVIKRGFKSVNIFDASVLALSSPAPSWAALLQQRKRWMLGIQYLPWYMSVILIIYASFYAFCLPFVAYTSVTTVICIFLVKLFLQSIFIHQCLRRLQLQMPVWLLIFFEFYTIFVSLISILFFLLPFKVRWKERSY